MNLSKDEKLQSGSLKTKKYLTERLEDLRKQNDELMTEAARAMLIGEIQAAKRLLKFISTDPVVVPDDGKFGD